MVGSRIRSGIHLFLNSYSCIEVTIRRSVLIPVSVANRVDWTTGSIFITPPGWWHSHHNDSQEEAWVLPIQDAGLYTHQRTLDIRFSDDEVASAEKIAASQMRPREEYFDSKES